MTEWLKVRDCKSLSKTYVGSNPTSFKIKIIFKPSILRYHLDYIKRIWYETFNKFKCIVSFNQ